MKKTTILSISLLTTLLPNIASAELLDISDTASNKTQNIYDEDNIMNILSNITTSVDTEVSDTSINAGGTVEQGSYGVSLGMGYLTPLKQFGYMSLSDYAYDAEDWAGKVVVHFDEANLNIGNTLKGNRVFPKEFYDNMKNTFKSQEFRTTLTKITEKDLPNLYIQTSDDGKQFISSTMYVRWLYDSDSKLNEPNKYITSRPILKGTNYTNGPYVAVGDNLDYDEKNGTEISNAGEKYAKSLTSITGKTYSNIPFLTKDRILKNTHPNYLKWQDTNKALLSKRCEYRRYISKKQSNVELGTFEYVYPVETVTTKTQSVVVASGLENKITSETIYTDNSKSEVQEFIFKIESKFPTPAKVYPTGNKTYEYSIKNSDGDIATSDKSLGIEPDENSADRWTSLTQRVLKITNPNGYVVYEKVIPDNTSKNLTISVLPSELKAPLLLGAKAELITSYDTFTRYMYEKQTIKNSYALNGNTSELKTYSQIIAYINDTANNEDKAKIDITKLIKYEETTNPRVIKKFKTAQNLGQTSNVKTSIEVPTGLDPVSPTPILTIDPPNALTKLEGGKFDVNIELKQDSFVFESEGNDVWISDMRVYPIEIIAQNGETIYKHPTPIVDFSDDKLEFTIPSLTANPSHIGKATVTATYSYVLNSRNWIEKEIVNPDGSHTIVREEGEITKTDHEGEIKSYFNIYSLSGVSKE